MTMTETYEANFKTADTKSLARFTRVIRPYDALTYKNLERLQVTQQEISTERKAGLIKYEPCLGIQRQEGGYSLTAAGVKKIYTTLKAALP